MASGFPGSIDNFTDPLSNSSLSSPSHAGQHADLNDAVEKIETYMGLVKVIPTSVAGTGVTLSASGTVSFSATTSVSVNGCFTSLYSNYQILIAGTSVSDTDCSFRFRAAGTDTSTAVYQYSSSGYFGSARNDASGTGQTSIAFTPSLGSSRTSGTTINVYSPNTTETWKATNASVTFTHSAVGVIVRNVAGACNSSTQFDGFTIFGGANLTGTIRVYGYRN
jgi:hypothetical protein